MIELVLGMVFFCNYDVLSLDIVNLKMFVGLLLFLEVCFVFLIFRFDFEDIFKGLFL